MNGRIRPFAVEYPARCAETVPPDHDTTKPKLKLIYDQYADYLWNQSIGFFPKLTRAIFDNSTQRHFRKCSYIYALINRLKPEATRQSGHSPMPEKCAIQNWIRKKFTARIYSVC